MPTRIGSLRSCKSSTAERTTAEVKTTPETRFPSHRTKRTANRRFKLGGENISPPAIVVPPTRLQEDSAGERLSSSGEKEDDNLLLPPPSDGMHEGQLKHGRAV